MLSAKFLPYDVYSRHQRIAEMISPQAAVLDVGGSLKELSRFISNPITTADVVGGDVTYDGRHLPFKDKNFDLVVSIDTIEHVPPRQRQSFIQELARVAKEKIILAAPMGTSAHQAAEKKLLRHYPGDTYLQEHVKYGLPTLQDIKTWVEVFPHHALSFSDNFRFANFMFRLHCSELSQPQLNRLWFFAKQPLSWLINTFAFPFLKDVSYTQATNRFFLEIELR